MVLGKILSVIAIFPVHTWDFFLGCAHPETPDGTM